MGGAVLSHYLSQKDLQNTGLQNEFQFYAFQVIDHDYNHGAIALDLANPEKPLTNEALFNRIEVLIKQAFDEKDLPFEECRSPTVILYKYSKLSNEEKTEFNKALLEAMIAQDKKEAKQKASAKAIDYSQSFGGTAEDTKNEREANELLRNANEMEDDTSSAKMAPGSLNAKGANEITPILSLPAVRYPSEHSALRSAGSWLKYLSEKGCYLYVHNLTKDMVAVKPDDFQEDDANAADGGAGSQEQVDEANGLPRVEFSQLPMEVERIVKELKKTPLIIDTSSNDVARTYFSYKGHLEDASCLTVPFGKSGLKKEDVMERCRKKLVAALKTGQTFALYLGGITIDHADFKTKLCKKDCFPKEVFINGGLKLLEPDYDPKYKAIYREEDLEAGQAVARDGFLSAVITTLSAFDYEKQLADSIPLGYMYPIYLVNSS